MLFIYIYFSSILSRHKLHYLKCIKIILIKYFFSRNVSEPIEINFKEYRRGNNFNGQIWLTMFISLLPKSQLRTIHLVGKNCSGLLKNTIEQK